MGFISVGRALSLPDEIVCYGSKQDGLTVGDRIDSEETNSLRGSHIPSVSSQLLMDYTDIP